MVDRLVHLYKRLFKAARALEEEGEQEEEEETSEYFPAEDIHTCAHIHEVYVVVYALLALLILIYYVHARMLFNCNHTRLFFFF